MAVIMSWDAVTGFPIIVFASGKFCVRLGVFFQQLDCAFLVQFGIRPVHVTNTASHK